MNASPQASTSRADLLPILILAAIQGWGLYGLHQSVPSHHWPATQPAWLVALYCVLVLVPVTLQLLVEHVHKPALWAIAGLLGAALFYFGWHHGDAVIDPRHDRFNSPDAFFALGLVLLVWWLHVLPFVQNRLAAGRWTLDYPLLFIHAWRNAVRLAEAALFTGLFWLILALWQALFHMLGIDFFRDLFDEPLFVYPATAVTFGCALYLIGSIDRLVSAVLDQILNVLKWLATITGVLLTLFTVALVGKLPGLVFTDQRAIGAGLLLWLIAVVVLFLNAAYRDGTVERPYPKPIALALRFSMPLMVVVAATALYALVVRTEHYGLTAERFWAFVVAGSATIYSIGYAGTAFRKGPWLSGIAHVNVAVALVLVVTIALALTPVLSPYRLAANSQFRLVLQGRYDRPERQNLSGTPFGYLRFDAGEYGRRKLQLLSNLQNHPNAEHIREMAAWALQQSNSWELTPLLEPRKLIAKLVMYPSGRVMDSDLAEALARDWTRWGIGDFLDSHGAANAAGVFADLDGDGIDEFILLTGSSSAVYRNRSGRWEHVGQAYSRGTTYSPDKQWEAIHADLSNGALSVTNPDWKDLVVGSHRFRIESEH